ncbi:MAG: hypothetical protein ABJK37_06370 [Paraglaciecola sp.]|uniref:hypothetical protein n=1 Tax=Paraglaciecola sp. TaxID=1920173 RepID=UPI00329A63CE
MDNNEEMQSEHGSHKKSNSRRKILKRASAGVVLTSLPAQSVWGAVCTLSGAQSGNMSGIERHKDCDKPVLSGGRSPGSWKVLAAGQLENPDKLRSIFINSPQSKQQGDYSSHDKLIRNCYISKIKEVAEFNSMVRPENVNDLITSDFKNDLYSALGLGGGYKPGGLDYNMAAVWLNVYFGLYDNSAYQRGDADSASAVVEQFLSYLMIQHNSGLGGTITDDDYGFTGGTTNFTISECDYLPEPDPTVPVEEPDCEKYKNGRKKGQCKN